MPIKQRTEAIAEFKDYLNGARENSNHKLNLERIFKVLSQITEERIVVLERRRGPDLLVVHHGQ